MKTFGPYVRHALPHSRRHALSNINGLELIWNTFGMDPAERVTTGIRLLEVWRQGSRDPDYYLMDLFERAEALQQVAPVLHQGQGPGGMENPR